MSKNEESQEDHQVLGRVNLKVVFFAAAVVVITIWSINLLVGTKFSIVPTVVFTDTNVGVFGDKFGAANSLFSGFALIGLIVAVFLQRDEIRLTKSEFKTAQEDLRETKKLQSKQQEYIENESRRSQNNSRENTFFLLLKSYVEARDSVNFSFGSGRFVTGISAFRSAGENWEDIKDAAYVCMKVLAVVIDFSDAKHIDDQEKYFYKKVIGSNMSDVECEVFRSMANDPELANNHSAQSVLTFILSYYENAIALDTSLVSD